MWKGVALVCFVGLISMGNILGQTRDTSISKKQKRIETMGNISLGYDYGYIPFAQNLNVPSGYFKAEGNFSITLKQLPFNATFFYTDLKNITGLNNYFRISFDLQSYKKKLMERASGKVTSYTSQINQLQKEYQTIQQKLGYLNHVNGNIDNYFSNYYSKVQLKSLQPDSLNLSLDSNTNLSVGSPIQFDSTEYEQLYSNYRDSLQDKYSDLRLQANEISEKIDELMRISEALTNPLHPNPMINVDSLVYKNKMEKWFCHLKKLDIGLCYPTYSTFLVNNIAVKGLNIEYENQNRFYAFTTGTTINNLLLTNNLIQNNLQNTQNLFNFFDFGSLQQGRKIISGKAGIGTKQGDHLFAGALYSIGQQSYYYDSTQANLEGTPLKEHNFVIELDGNVQVKKWLALNIVYGKSSLRPLHDESDTTNVNLTQLFSPFRSNAALCKAILSFSKIKSTITLSGRIVDPFFRSYGIGFMRSDNLRFEIKSTHQLGKKMKAGLFYRKDQNNLLDLFSYTTILQTGGANFQYRVNKSISIRGNFNPVFQNSYNESDQTNYNNQNYIATLMVSHNYRVNEIAITSNLSSSYYKLFNGTGNTDYSNMTLSNAIHFKKINNNFSASFFKMNGIDSLSGNTVMLYNDLSCQLQKLRISAGLKFSDNQLYGNQFGYSLKLNGQISKNISLELRGEKLVLGDFYNSIGIDQYRSYPYIWSSRVIINW